MWPLDMWMPKGEPNTFIEAKWIQCAYMAVRKHA